MHKPKVFYGWVLVAVGFLAIAFTGSLWHTFPVFLVALVNDFGESRASTTLIFTIFTSVAGVVAPLTGQLVDRFGARRIMPIGATIVFVGLLISSRAEAVWQLYLAFGVFSAIGWCGAGSLSTISVLQNWFVRKRGIAIGLVMTGAAVGNFILLPLTQYIITGWGWRTAYLVLAALLLLIAPMTLVFQRQRPQDMGLLPDGDSADDSARQAARARATALVVDQQWTGRAWDLPAAVRVSRFWFLVMVGFLGFGGQQIVMVHSPAYMIGQGFDPMWAAGFLAMVLGLGAGTKILLGFLSDQVGREWAFTVGVACGLMGTVVLMMTTPTGWSGLPYLYAVLFSVWYGGLATMPITMAADLFQGRRFGSVYGVFVMGNYIAGGLTPWVAAYVFDVSGSYYVAFLMSMVLMSIACGSAWMAAPRKVRMVAGVAKRRARLAANLSAPQESPLGRE